MFPFYSNMSEFIPPKWFSFGGWLTTPKEITNDIKFESKNLALELHKGEMINNGN